MGSAVGSVRKATCVAKGTVRTRVAMTALTAVDVGNCAVLVQIAAKERAKVSMEVILPIVAGVGRSAKQGRNATSAFVVTTTNLIFIEVEKVLAIKNKRGTTFEATSTQKPGRSILHGGNGGPESSSASWRYFCFFFLFGN